MREIERVREKERKRKREREREREREKEREREREREREPYDISALTDDHCTVCAPALALLSDAATVFSLSPSRFRSVSLLCSLRRPD
jgi:hypothetical protein